MDYQSLNRVFYILAEKLPAYALPNVKEQIERSGITEQQVIYGTMEMKDPTIAIILSVLLGSLGIDRFYIGDIGLGVVKLLTCGGVGIWWLIDLFVIMDRAKEKNYLIFQQMVGGTGFVNSPSQVSSDNMSFEEPQ